MKNQENKIASHASSTGEKLVTATIASNQETYFNCTQLPHGLYLIFAEMGDAIFKQKLVVR